MNHFQPAVAWTSGYNDCPHEGPFNIAGTNRPWILQEQIEAEGLSSYIKPESTNLILLVTSDCARAFKFENFEANNGIFVMKGYFNGDVYYKRKSRMSQTDGK